MFWYFSSLKVYDEILAVLKHVEERNMEHVSNNSIDFSHISAQTIFSIFDCLTRWVRLKEDSTAKTQLVTTRPERNEGTGICRSLITMPNIIIITFCYL